MDSCQALKETNERKSVQSIKPSTNETGEETMKFTPKFVIRVFQK